ncbi:MAG: hypothetical protein ACQEP8_05680 [Chlamydiota bacterium]
MKRNFVLLLAGFSMLAGFNSLNATLSEEFSEQVSWLWGDDESSEAQTIDISTWNKLENLNKNVSSGIKKLKNVLDNEGPEGLLNQALSSLHTAVEKYTDVADDYLTGEVKERMTTLENTMHEHLEEIETLVNNDNIDNAKEVFSDFMDQWQEAQDIVKDNIQEPQKGDSPMSY